MFQQPINVTLSTYPSEKYIKFDIFVNNYDL